MREPETRRDWMMQFLSNSLDDKTDTGWRYGPDYDRQPIRICDEAAKSLAEYLPNVGFEYEQNAEFNIGAANGVLIRMGFELRRPGNSHVIASVQTVRKNESELLLDHYVFDGASFQPASDTWVFINEDFFRR